VTASARGRRAGGRLLPFAACIALLLSACTTGLRSSPSPSPSPKTPLAQADSKFFSGDYEGAEKGYRQAIDGGATDAHSHYALLLTYEARFREAVDEARKGAAASSDSFSQAALTRALDWSDDPSDALTAGARAVAAKPTDALAHIYYGEALSDSGQYAAAQAELRRGESSAGDTYARAEAAREWANYYGGQGDTEQQLNYIQISQHAQPDFPERSLELARFEYTAGRPDLAQKVTAAVQKKRPHDYWVLKGLGDVALLAKDTPAATNFYNAALSARAQAPEASLALAEIQVALNHDFNSGHDVARASLKQNPSSFDLYEYLAHLDTLVLHIDPATDLGAPPADVAATLTADRKSALDAVNGVRAHAGLGTVADDTALDAGADAHAFYYLFNVADSSVSGLGIHTETSTLPGYTGADALQRAHHFGYSGNVVAEVLDHVYLPEGGVVDWRNSVYHRIPLLLHETEKAGYGEAQVGTIRIELIDFGIGADTHAGPIVYPLDGQKDVPTAFVGNEIPDPAPQGALYPLGYTVTLEAGIATQLSVTSGRLLGPDGKEVASYQLKPGSDLDPFDWALLPAGPLTPGRTYTVEVIGTLDGQSLDKRWTFTVASGP
jgi:uncharacterized protein YkwD/Tfp pilus assembly protein PilF